MDPQSKPLFFCSYPLDLPYPNVDWTLEENAIFEKSLAILDHDSPEFFENIASIIPGKSAQQVEQHFNKLKYYFDMILSGKVKLPKFNTTSVDDQGNKSVAPIVENEPCHPQIPRKESTTPIVGNKSLHPGQSSRGLRWTDEEHKSFLEGLERYGKGDWKSISRDFVKTRTPTQVASHAQKHFIKQDANSASTSKDASTTISMATTPSPRLSGPSAAATIADQYITAYPPYYQHQS